MSKASCRLVFMAALVCAISVLTACGGGGGSAPPPPPPPASATVSWQNSTSSVLLNNSGTKLPITTANAVSCSYALTPTPPKPGSTGTVVATITADSSNSCLAPTFIPGSTMPYNSSRSYTVTVTANSATGATTATATAQMSITLTAPAPVLVGVAPVTGWTSSSQGLLRHFGNGCTFTSYNLPSNVDDPTSWDGTRTNFDGGAFIRSTFVDCDNNNIVVVLHNVPPGQFPTQLQTPGPGGGDSGLEYITVTSSVTGRGYINETPFQVQQATTGKEGSLTIGDVSVPLGRNVAGGFALLGDEVCAAAEKRVTCANVKGNTTNRFFIPEGYHPTGIISAGGRLYVLAEVSCEEIPQVRMSATPLPAYPKVILAQQGDQMFGLLTSQVPANARGIFGVGNSLGVLTDHGVLFLDNQGQVRRKLATLPGADRAVAVGDDYLVVGNSSRGQFQFVRVSDGLVYPVQSLAGNMWNLVAASGQVFASVDSGAIYKISLHGALEVARTNPDDLLNGFSVAGNGNFIVGRNGESKTISANSGGAPQ